VLRHVKLLCSYGKQANLFTLTNKCFEHVKLVIVISVCFQVDIKMF